MNRPPLAHPPARTALAPDFDAPHFRQALGRFATGVTVITTRVPDTDPARTDSAAFVGITASSFNTVSLDPPLVLWSLGAKANSLPLFHAGSHYAIHVLAADQLDLCQRFARGQGDRFEGLSWRLGQAGVPLLDGVLAWFECHNRSRYEEGDHVIFVGEVERCGLAPARAPLLFQGGAFHTTQALGQP